MVGAGVSLRSRRPSFRARLERLRTVITPLSYGLNPLGRPRPSASAGLSLGSPTLLLDASLLSGSDGDPIGTWTNTGSAGGSFTASGSTRPTLQTAERNGKNVVRGDGTDDVLDGNTFATYFGSSAKTIIAVVKTPASFGIHANVYDAPPWLADSGGYFGLHAVQRADNRYEAYNYDTAVDLVSVAARQPVVDDGSDLWCITHRIWRNPVTHRPSSRISSQRGAATTRLAFQERSAHLGR